jgi:hypothetical protein
MLPDSDMISSRVIGVPTGLSFPAIFPHPTPLQKESPAMPFLSLRQAVPVQPEAQSRRHASRISPRDGQRDGRS